MTPLSYQSSNISLIVKIYRQIYRQTYQNHAITSTNPILVIHASVPCHYQWLFWSPIM